MSISNILTILLQIAPVPQTVRHQVRGVRAGDPPHPGGAAGPGQRVPPPLLRLHPLPASTQHGGRVLPHGGQQTRLQKRLRAGQATRSVPY